MDGQLNTHLQTVWHPCLTVQSYKEENVISLFLAVFYISYCIDFHVVLY